jgi:predicted RNA binding protein YcfA (HicA-like mRNA interferase family)
LDREFLMAKSSKHSFFGWLGRQMGYVKGGVSKDVTPPKVLYKKSMVRETTVPDRPGEKLRRTVIDEVVRDPKQLPKQWHAAMGARWESREVP